MMQQYISCINFHILLQIAGSFHSTYVVLSVVDLTKVHPFGGPAPVTSPIARDLSPFQKGHSVRKSFSKEKPPKQGWTQYYDV